MAQQAPGTRAKFRLAAHAILATLPSRVASQQGTTVSWKKLSQSRRQSMVARTGHKDASRRRRSTIGPDLFSSMEKKGLKTDFSAEDEYDEVERLKQIEIIRQMPVSIAQKRKLRDKLFSHMPDASDSSCSTLCYRLSVARFRWRLACKKNWRDFTVATTLWGKAFKTIEGHFGSGVLSYFRFLKSLFLMNVVVFLTMFLFVVVPMLSFPEMDYSAILTGNENTTEAVYVALNCSERYTVNTTGVWYEYILSVLQGTGFMEKTLLFYGHYSDKELEVTTVDFSYNLPFAYVTCINLILLFFLACMVTLSARSFRNRLFSNEEGLKKYSNKVFTAWDHALNDEDSAVIKHKTILRDIECSLEEDRDKNRRTLKTTKQRCGIITVRILLNVLVLAILGGSGYLIYFTTVKTAELVSGADYSSYHLIIQFLVEYMTSLSITGLNGLVPIIFKKLVTFEDYTPAVSVNVTLGRTVFLRLASLAVLIFSLYVNISCTPKDYCNVGTDTCTPVECWETYVGQELYKLVIMDFIVVVAIIFFVEFPRRLIVSNCSCKVAQIVGFQEFDISKNVLDLVYSQSLLWLGLLYSPMIPVITVIKNVLVFYLKMLTTLKNYVPSSKPYEASDSDNFFQILLLTTFTACVVPTMYVMWRMTPSRGCGPFRIHDYMIDIVPVAIETWPTVLVSIINFIWSASIIICVMIALGLTIHYLNMAKGAYKDMVGMLKEQLYLEGQDKHFLVARIQQLTSSGVKTDKLAMTSAMSAVSEDVEAPRTSSQSSGQHLDSPPNVPLNSV